MGSLAKFAKLVIGCNVDCDIFIPRRLFDNEILKAAGLLKILQEISFGDEDTLVWKDDSNFFYKALYKFIKKRKAGCF